MKKIDKRIIVIILIVLLLIILVFLLSGKNDKNVKKRDLYSVSVNNFISDEFMTLYRRYNSEDGLKYQIIGNNDSDYYGLYYSNSELTFKDFPNILKNYILLDTINYQNYGYDDQNNCSLYSLEEYKDTYRKNFGSNDDFNIDDVDGISIIGDNLCIGELYRGSDLSYTYDTYLVGVINDEDNIIISERVVFIDIKEDYYYFYRDYEMTDLVYKLENTSDVDVSFINNSEVVSNVLLEFQNELDIYEYTYVKGVDTYYLESIKK